MLEFRYGVWAPPHSVWDIITSYVGFVTIHRIRAQDNWDIYRVLDCSNVCQHHMFMILDRIPEVNKAVTRAALHYGIEQAHEVRTEAALYLAE